MTIWEIASVPFWLLAVYFIVDVFFEALKPKGSKCIPCALACAGLFGYIAARIAT